MSRTNIRISGAVIFLEASCSPAAIFPTTGTVLPPSRAGNDKRLRVGLISGMDLPKSAGSSSWLMTSSRRSNVAGGKAVARIWYCQRETRPFVKVADAACLELLPASGASHVEPESGRWVVDLLPSRISHCIHLRGP